MPKCRVKRHAVIQPLDKPFRFIPLTQWQNAIVDAEDFEWLSQWNWYANWSSQGKTFYAWRKKQKNTVVQMHREILQCAKKEEADHRNHNTLDNRRENLRKCNRHENMRNTRIRSDNKTGFKGVSWDNWSNKWVVRINIDGHCRNFGRFSSVKEAALAYDVVAKKHYRQFANPNF